MSSTSRTRSPSPPRTTPGQGSSICSAAAIGRGSESTPASAASPTSLPCRRRPASRVSSCPRRRWRLCARCTPPRPASRCARSSRTLARCRQRARSRHSPVSLDSRSARSTSPPTSASGATFFGAAVDGAGPARAGRCGGRFGVTGRPGPSRCRRPRRRNVAKLGRSRPWQNTRVVSRPPSVGYGRTALSWDRDLCGLLARVFVFVEPSSGEIGHGCRRIGEARDRRWLS